MTKIAKDNRNLIIGVLVIAIIAALFLGTFTGQAISFWSQPTPTDKTLSSAQKVAILSWLNDPNKCTFGSTSAFGGICNDYCNAVNAGTCIESFQLLRINGALVRGIDGRCDSTWDKNSQNGKYLELNGCRCCKP